MHYSYDKLDMTTESLSGNIAFNSHFKCGQPLAGHETRDVHAKDAHNLASFQGSFLSFAVWHGK